MAEITSSEPQKTPESRASGETTQKIDALITSIARKEGPAHGQDGCFEGHIDDLDPEKLNGYESCAVKRFTLPAERKNPTAPFASAIFTKREGDIEIDTIYELSKDEEGLRIDKNDKTLNINKKTKKEISITKLGQSKDERRKSGESLVSENEAQELLILLRQVEDGSLKEKELIEKMLVAKQHLDINPGEVSKMRVERLEQHIKKANGHLYPLRKEISGKKILFSIRHFKRNNLNSDTSLVIDSSLVIDVFSDEEPVGFDPTPIGHMDWWISGDHANGGANQHVFLEPNEGDSHEIAAKAKWEKSRKAFVVDDEFSKNGIGSFLLAVSALALNNLGVKTFYPGLLLNAGEATYDKFGITLRGEGSMESGQKSIFLEKLNSSSQIEKSLSEFA